MRRVIITRSAINFAFAGEETIIDHIPIDEVTYIKEMAETISDEATNEDSSFAYMMQIATRDDGYNSGRTYYLSTSSRDQLVELISYLTRAAEKARVNAEARTFLSMLQLRIRRWYESRIFQRLMALLIAAVSREHHPQHNPKCETMADISPSPSHSPTPTPNFSLVAPSHSKGPILQLPLPPNPAFHLIQPSNTQPHFPFVDQIQGRAPSRRG